MKKRSLLPRRNFECSNWLSKRRLLSKSSRPRLMSRQSKMIQALLLKLIRKPKGWRFSVNMHRKKLSSKERMRLSLRNLRPMSLRD